MSEKKICPRCGSELSDYVWDNHRECPNCGLVAPAFHIWYDEIRDLSEQACQHVSQIFDDWSNYAGAIDAEDVRGARDTRRIKSDFEELRSVTFKIHERLGTIEAQTRQLTFWENLKNIIFEKTFELIFGIAVIAILGYLGISWLLG